MNTQLEENARRFAIGWHGMQKRKYTFEPYWHHCREVAEIVRGVEGATPEMLTAAWLHDCIEDTPVTIDKIRDEFGPLVARYVWFLSDSPQVAGNRDQRKILDRARLALAPPEVKTIKLADLIDNSRSILARDPHFAVTYLREKALVLEVLREGSPVLWQQAFEIVREYQDSRLQEALRP